MVTAAVRRTGIAVSGLAAFVWASYYLIVLELPSSANLTILVVPFLFGGLPFAGLAVLGSSSEARGILRTMATPGGAARGLILLVMQADVVFSTRIAGAVDTSLVTLVADVIVTPILLFAIWREGGRHVRQRIFWLGVLLSGVGASLTILAGGSTQPVTLLSLGLLVPLPFLVSLYFLLMVRAARTAPMATVVASGSLLAFLIGAVALLVLQGPAGLGIYLGARDLLLITLLGVSSFFLAPWAFFWAAEKLTIVVPAVLQAAIPLFTLILVVLILHYPATWLAVLGIPIAMLGSYFAVAEGGEPPAPRPPDTLKASG